MDLLGQATAVCPVPILALVPQGDGSAQQEPIAPNATLFSALYGLFKSDCSYEVWVDPTGRFVAVAPGCIRGASLASVPGWNQWAELQSRALRALLSELSPEQTAVVATGRALRIAELSPRARQLLTVLIPAFLIGGGPTADAALADPHSELRIDFVPLVTVVTDPPSPGRAARQRIAYPLRPARASLPSERRSAEVGPADAKQREAAVAAYAQYLAGLEASAPEDPGVLPDGIVAVRDGALGLGELLAMVSAAIGRPVSIDGVDTASTVVLSPGEWRVAALLDALSVASRSQCRISAAGVRLTEPATDLPVCVAAQLDLAPDWATLAFDRAFLARADARQFRELSAAQQSWLQDRTSRGTPAGLSALPEAALVMADPSVTVRVVGVAEMEAVGGTQSGTTSQPVGLWDATVAWFFERMPRAAGADGAQP